MKKYIAVGLCLIAAFMTGCGEKGVKIGTYVCDDQNSDEAPKLYILDDTSFSISYVNDPDEAEYVGIYEIQDDKLLLYDIEDFNPIEGTKENPTLEFSIEKNKLIYEEITEHSLNNVYSGNEFVLSKED